MIVKQMDEQEWRICFALCSLCCLPLRQGAASDLLHCVDPLKSSLFSAEQPVYRDALRQYVLDLGAVEGESVATAVPTSQLLSASQSLSEPL